MTGRQAGRGDNGARVKPKWPMPPTLLFAAIAAMVLLHVLLPLGRIIPAPWRYGGILPMVFGAVWNLWADQLFKKSRTTVKPHLEPTALVSAGPYARSRNPMYVGMVAIVTGLAVVLGTVTPLAVVPLLAALLALKFVPAEEQAMAEAFGEAWQQYKSRVRRWL